MEVIVGEMESRFSPTGRMSRSWAQSSGGKGRKRTNLGGSQFQLNNLNYIFLLSFRDHSGPCLSWREFIGRAAVSRGVGFVLFGGLAGSSPVGKSKYQCKLAGSFLREWAG